MNKNKIIEIFNEIKGNKKVAIAILVIFILIAGIVATAITTINKPAKRKVENVKRSIKDVDNEDVEQVTETPENTGNDSATVPNEKPSRKTFTEKEKNTDKVEKKESKKSETRSNASTPSSTAKAKTRVWVVDKAAWTEKVTKYRTETQEYTVYRNGHGQEFPDYSSAYKVYVNDPTSGGFGPVTKYRTVTVPYYEYINHPEQGHYEYR